MKRLLTIGLLVTVAAVVVAFTIPARDDAPGLDEALEAWEAIAEELRASDPRPGPVPDHENAAVVYLRAFAALDGLSPRERMQCLDGGMVGPAPDADLIERIQGAVAAAHEAAALRSCDWHAATARLGDARAVRLQSVEVALLAGALGADAVFRSEQGDLVTAVRDVESLYALAEHAATLPHPTGLGSLTTRELMAFATLSRIFRDRDMPPSRLGKMLERRDYPTLRRQALHAEGSWVLAGFDELGGSLSDQERRECKARYVQTMLRLYETIDDAQDFSWLDERVDDVLPFAAPDRRLTPRPRDMELAAGLETRAVLVRAALALRAYRAEHAGYPAAWPSDADPWSSEIRYRREGSGFVVSAADRQGKVIRLAWD
jgi:hypothetical protein